MATTIEVSVDPQFDALTKTRVARDLAERWATEGEDVVVKNGKYSALHHRTKAENFKNTAQTEASNAADSATKSKQHAQETSQFTDPDGNTFDKGAKGHAQDAEAAAPENSKATLLSLRGKDETEVLRVEEDGRIWGVNVESPIDELVGTLADRVSNRSDGALFRLEDKGGTARMYQSEDGSLYLPGLDGSVQDKIVEANTGTANVPILVPSSKTSSAIQSVLNTLSSNGGGICMLEDGTYDITESIFVPSNVVIRGSGMGKTVLRVSDSFSFESIGINLGIVLWTANNPTSFSDHVTVSDLTIEARNSNFSGFIFGAGALWDRSIDPSEQIEAHSDYCEFRRLEIIDSHIPIGISKTGQSQEYEKDRTFNHRGWIIENCRASGVKNKAFEMQEMTGGVIAKNFIQDVEWGPQFIHDCHRCVMVGNTLRFGGGGYLPASHNSDSIVFANNLAYYDPNSSFGNPANAGIIIKVDPPRDGTGNGQEQKNLVLKGNVIDMRDATTGHTLKFRNLSSNANSYWNDITISANRLLGAKTEINFTGNEPSDWHMKRVDLRDNVIEELVFGDQTEIQDIIVQANRINTAVTIPPGPDDVALAGNRVPSITDNGTGNTVQNNF